MRQSRRSDLLRALAAALALQWRSAPLVALAAYAASVLGGLCAAASGWLLKALLDELGRAGAASPDRPVALAVAAAAVAGGAGAILYLIVYLNQVIRWRVTIAVEQALLGKVNRLVGLRELETPSFQGQIQLAEQAAQEAPQQLSELMLALVQTAVAVISSATLVWIVMPSMVWILLVAAAVAVVAQIQRSRRDARLSESLVQTYRWRDYHRQVLLDLRAAKEVRLYGLGDLLLGRLLGSLRAIRDGETALARRTALVQAGLAILSGIVTAAGAAVVVQGALAGRLQVGDVALFLAAVAGVQHAISNLVVELGPAGRSALLFRNYLAVMDRPAPPTSRFRRAPPLATGIELRGAWFRYDPAGPWVLSGLDLAIPAGQALGLVGLNGAGKSTLVKLLCRFWDLEEGQLLWNGIDVRDIDPASLRRRIAVTFQDYMTWDATAADNIGFGDARHLGDRRGIRAAAALAEIDRKLVALPDGYDSLLSRSLAAEAADRGIALSGGEWQRVALARSMFRAGADLVVLDEPSSGLDAAAEFRLHQAILRRTRGKTRLLISHRLSALRQADRIAVMSDGRIVEDGTHDALMARGGRYAELFALQALGYQDARVLPLMQKTLA